MSFGMIKTVRRASEKLTLLENGVYAYHKEVGSPTIDIFPANLARAHLGRGYQRNVTNDTDDIPHEITKGRSILVPLVCAPPQLNGCFVPAVFDRERDTMTIYDHATDDACEAARIARDMIVNEGASLYDLVGA